MKQFFRPFWDVILVLIGAIVQIVGIVILQSLGISYSDDLFFYLLSFWGIFSISLIVFKVFWMATWGLGKTESDRSTLQRSADHSAIKSRDATIQNLKLKLANTEKRLNVSNRACSEAEARLKNLGIERDKFKQAHVGVKNELEQERQNTETFQTHIKALERERDSFKQSSERTKNELAQERENVVVLQTHVNDLKREGDSFKQANERINGELEQERLKVELSHNHIRDLERELNACLATISADLTNGDSLVLVSTQAWKKMGDSHEIQRWKGLFLKIKNPLLRSQQERPNGDGWVYPASRSSDGRRVMYLKEKKEITIIKLCEIFRTHDDNWKYDDIRTEGMELLKYKDLSFSYVTLENTT